MKHKILGGRRSKGHVLVLNHGVQAVPEGSQMHVFMFAGDGETPRAGICLTCFGLHVGPRVNCIETS